MKLSKVSVNDRGMAMVVELVLVAVVLAAAGYGIYVFHANSKKAPIASASPAPASSGASAGVDASCVATYHDVNICHFASNSTSFNKMAYTSTITEVASGQSSTLTLENDGNGGTSLSGTSAGTQFSSIQLAGATYLQSGGTWIKYPSGSSAPGVSNPTSSMNIGVGSSGITYKEIDTEACGNLTCFKYQITDSSSPSTTQFAWFDNKSYLLREWKYTDNAGNSSDMSISYGSVSITAPAQFQTIPSAQ